jgi:acyl-CoA hydrolase
MTTFISAESAVSIVESGMRVFVQGSAATPHHLLRALAGRARELTNVEIIAISMLGDVHIQAEAFRSNLFFNSLFVSQPIRDNVNGENGDYIPVFLSEITKLFERGLLPLDVAFIHVSPPDKHGYCSLGVSVDVARSAFKHARIVVAQVNPNMPRTHGDGLIHTREIHYMVETHDPLPEVNYSAEVGDCERAIGTADSGINSGQGYTAAGYWHHTRCRAELSGRTQRPRYPYRNAFGWSDASDAKRRH